MKLKCKLSPGKVWRSPDPDDKKWTKDQLSDKEVWIHPRTWSKYLRNTYGITLQQYYNIIVHDDIDYSPVCSVCNNEIPFRGLYRGYQTYCSKSCYHKSEELSNRMSVTMRDLNSDPEFYEANRKRQSERLKTLWEDESYAEEMSSMSKSTWNDPDIRKKRIEGMKASWDDPDRRDAASETQSEIMKKRWSDLELRKSLVNPISVMQRELSRSILPDTEPWYFYIAKTDRYPDWYKIGITQDIRGRMHGGYYDKTISILTTLTIAAKLECELKIFIDSEDLNKQDKLSSEWFTKDNTKQFYNKIIELIDSYKLDKSNFKVINK